MFSWVFNEFHSNLTAIQTFFPLILSIYFRVILKKNRISTFFWFFFWFSAAFYDSPMETKKKTDADRNGRAAASAATGVRSRRRGEVCVLVVVVVVAVVVVVVVVSPFLASVPNKSVALCWSDSATKGERERERNGKRMNEWKSVKKKWKKEMGKVPVVDQRRRRLARNDWHCASRCSLGVAGSAPFRPFPSLSLVFFCFHKKWIEKKETCKPPHRPPTHPPTGNFYFKKKFFWDVSKDWIGLKDRILGLEKSCASKNEFKIIRIDIHPFLFQEKLQEIWHKFIWTR